MENRIQTGQNEVVIEGLMKWKEEHGAVTIEQYNQDYGRTEAAIARGEFTTHEEAMKRIRSRRD